MRSRVRSFGAALHGAPVQWNDTDDELDMSPIPTCRRELVLAWTRQFGPDTVRVLDRTP